MKLGSSTCARECAVCCVLCARPALTRSGHYLLYSVSQPSEMCYVAPNFQVEKQRPNMLTSLLKVGFPGKLWRQHHLKFCSFASEYVPLTSPARKFVWAFPLHFHVSIFWVMIFFSSGATVLTIFSISTFRNFIYLNWHLLCKSFPDLT